MTSADTTTCALTGDGQLLTWGEAASCSLGYTGNQRQYIPRLVGGAIADRVIVQVSTITLSNSSAAVMLKAAELDLTSCQLLIQLRSRDLPCCINFFDLDYRALMRV